jgi:flagellar biosynthesis protein
MHNPPPPPPERDSDVTEAAALSYNQGIDGAPKMIAKGRGKIADRILELASENDLPIHRDPTLIAVLGALDVGAEVPPDLYGVIAEVLAWAYHTDKTAADARVRRRAA